VILGLEFPLTSTEIHAMAAAQYRSCPLPARFLAEQLASASPDLLRSMGSTFIQALMSAEADAGCGAPYGQPGPERTNQHNGYRHRDFDARLLRSLHKRLIVSRRPHVGWGRPRPPASSSCRDPATCQRRLLASVDRTTVPMKARPSGICR
jgi:hypothetical protein